MSGVLFEDAISTLVGLVEFAPGAEDELSTVGVVRDLVGRLGLVVRRTGTPRRAGGARLDLGALEHALRTRLGAWFRAPILDTASEDPVERRMAKALLERAATWPTSWPATVQDPHDLTAAARRIDRRAEGALRWVGLDRSLSKQAWISGTGRGEKAPWPLSRGTPAVVAFYSFKGGVGRSTLLGVLAYQLARQGKRVVCVDLDLEAPGLAPLFGVQGGADDERLRRGVVDELMEDALRAAWGHEHVLRDHDAPTVPLVEVGRPSGGALDANGTAAPQASWGLVPAGFMSRSYIEKLSRLDYVGTVSTEGSPVARGLRSLLRRIKDTEPRPDFVFLDSRTGLHDLGGLSLVGLAHVDVLVTRDTGPGRQGMELVLDLLARERPAAERRLLLVQSFVPHTPNQPEVARGIHEAFRRAMYEVCQRTIYAADEDQGDLPAEEDQDVAHYPWPVRQLDELALAKSLLDVDPRLLEHEDYQAIRDRLLALTSPEGTSDA